MVILDLVRDSVVASQISQSASMTSRCGPSLISRIEKRNMSEV